MKIIVPMAGRGSRLRPHTLTIPKPLIPIAGKPIVYQLIEDIAKVVQQKIDEIAFVLHQSFGKQIENDLITIAEKLNSKATIYYQNESLGTAHAILCAEKSLNQEVIVAYADTLFRADFTLDTTADSVIWVKQIENPSDFGVVKLNEKNEIIDFVEKPKEFVSNLAIIGIYYFKNGEILRNELQYLLDNNIIKNGEYQLTDALKNMQRKKMRFLISKVDKWMDCGSKGVTIQTNTQILEILHKERQTLVSPSVINKKSIIIEPCFIGENVVLKNSVVGPNVSIGENTIIENVTIKNSLIQTHTQIRNATLNKAMIGNFVTFDGNYTSVSIGDYSTLV